MADDHLSNETSLSAELTETGVKASVRSRTIAAFDRLLGGAIDIGSAHLEGYAVRRRAKTEGERQLIEATAQYGLGLVQSDDEFARRAFEAHYRNLAHRQVNKDAVVSAAVEDLRTQPPSEHEAATGQDYLSDEFMNRFERLAEEASSEELREKWGRVLAAEIRNPNTFSGRVLRVIDELDGETARLFERVCEHHVDGVLVKPTLGTLDFRESSALAAAELIVEPGIGHIRYCSEVSDQKGVPSWFFPFGAHAVSIVKSEKLPPKDKAKEVLSHTNNQPSMPVYVLTNVGKAIASILPDRSADVIKATAEKLSVAAPEHEIRRYVLMSQPPMWVVVEILPPKGSGP